MITSYPGRWSPTIELLRGDASSSSPAERTVAPTAVRVLIVDDHPVVRAGIIDLLNEHEWLVVVGQAGDGREALDKARKLLPDLVVVDLNLPKFNGLALLKSLRAQLPKCKLVVLSMHDPAEFGLAIVESGARGYICKKVASDVLVTALETVARGGIYFDPAFSQMALNHFSRDRSRPMEMSPREREVLIGIAEGLSNKEIAARLKLGIRTIDTHRERLVRKLNIHSVAGLTRFALQQGLVPES